MHTEPPAVDAITSHDSWEDVDPLYDPAFTIFVYAGWAFTSHVVGDTAGLGVLVAATALLTVTGVLSDRDPQAQPFKAEFSTILLYCAAAIGTAVLALRLL